jgi:hypothetical protein
MTFPLSAVIVAGIVGLGLGFLIGFFTFWAVSR